MSRKKTVEGVCQICGLVGKMSEEHVPPQGAFFLSKQRKVSLVTFEEALRLGPMEAQAAARQFRGGFKTHTLCEPCNNKTGHWYGSAFIDWCRGGIELLDKSRPAAAALSIAYYLYPLRVLKQVVTMFFSVNDARLRANHPELVRFVLNKESRYLPPDYRFFVYFNPPGSNFRYEDFKGIMDTDTGQFSLASEIAYPPFGYVFTMGSGPLDDRHAEITHFARFGYQEQSFQCLRLPMLVSRLVESKCGNCHLDYFACECSKMTQEGVTQEIVEVDYLHAFWTDRPVR